MPCLWPSLTFHNQSNKAVCKMKINIRVSKKMFPVRLPGMIKDYRDIICIQHIQSIHRYIFFNAFFLWWIFSYNNDTTRFAIKSLWNVGIKTHNTFLWWQFVRMAICYQLRIFFYLTLYTLYIYIGINLTTIVLAIKYNLIYIGLCALVTLLTQMMDQNRHSGPYLMHSWRWQC